MAFNISDKIEAIRQKPEHIRMRYAVGLALLCMIFVTLLWLLTIKQSFRGVSPETRSRVNEVTGTLREAGTEFKQETRSLKDLPAGESLEVTPGEQKTEEFVAEEITKGTKPVLGIPSFSE
jgi:hypothetical protein